MIIFIYITHKNICCIAHSILLPKLKRNTSYLLICLQGKGLMHQESNWYFFPWQWFGKGVSGSHRGWILNWNGNSCYYYKVTYVLSILLEDVISWFPLNISLWADIESCGICLLPLPDLSSLLPTFLGDVQMQGSISLYCQESHFSHSHLCLCIPLMIICCALSVLWLCCGVCARVCVVLPAAQACKHACCNARISYLLIGCRYFI